MMGPRKPSRRMLHGLSLLELLLALTITVMVAGAIAAMLGAVSTGVSTRRDNRTVMVLANAAQSRLAAYIAPSQCVLAINGSNVTLWLADSRESGTVHATEIRWLLFDASRGVLTAHYVSFPESWSQAACDLEDLEYEAETDWAAVLASYQSKGWTASQDLVDTLDSVTVLADAELAMASRHLTYQLAFETDAEPVPITVAATIRLHEPPAN